MIDQLHPVLQSPSVRPQTQSPTLTQSPLTHCPVFFAHSLLQVMCRYNNYSETSNKEHSKRGQTFQLKKGQAENALVYTLYRKSPLKENNLSTKDKTAGPESVPITEEIPLYSLALKSARQYNFLVSKVYRQGAPPLLFLQNCTLTFT